MPLRRRPGAHAAAPAAIAAGGNIGSASATYIGTQVLGVSALPVAAAAKDPGPVFTAVGVEAFTGRAWLAGQVDRFLATNPNGYVFVEAEAGLGKTAFAAWLVKTRGYLSHFSRYSGGRSVRAALQNLSAQLVREFGLDEQAPGGMLPEWAQTPGGFESILGMAAARARPSGHPLVLVVDGLDEAEPPDDGLAFGLPSLLPEGAYIIGTYRTGSAPRRPEAPAVTVRISKSDRRNASDIRDFLSKAVMEEVLAARLAEAGINPADFVAMLAERCDGVFVYLRYVLQEVRIGLRAPGTIGDMPSGLRDYYADQIRGWQKDPAWNESLLPLLATLAVAGDPLPAAVLARLAGGLDAGVVRRWCDFTLRPLLTTTPATHAASLPHYEIYHASFREVLQGLPGEQSSYELQILSYELRHATLCAHSRIAARYLTEFGGLDASLPVLGNEPAVASADHGYPLRHLARHLHQAGRVGELHRLLAAVHPHGDSREVNVWFEAHDHADCLASYVDDLTRARNISAADTDDALAAGRTAPSLGSEIRYALMAASIASRASRISPDLLELLVRTGLWSPGRGLDHARRLTEPVDRFQALLAVHQHVDAAERPGIIEESLAAATAITEEGPRAYALAELAPYLPPDQKADAVAQALVAFSAIIDEDALIRVLAKLVPYLAPDGKADATAEALAAISAITDEQYRAMMLTGLVPHLPPDQQPDAVAQALADAFAGDHEYSRAVALTGIALYLPPDQQPDALAQAFAAAIATDEEYLRAEALAGLAPHLPPDLLALALAAATEITDERFRALALTGLAPYLPPDKQSGAVAQAVAATIAITDEYSLADALADLAPQLTQDLLTQALAAATGISGGVARARALTGLSPYLPRDQQHDVLIQALDAATAIADHDSRAEALAALVPYLPPDQQTDALTQALDAASTIPDESWRAQALAELVPYLPPHQRPRALTVATDAANSITDEDSRAEALAALAPYLPPDALARALDAASSMTSEMGRGETLGALAPHLPPDLLTQALASASAIAEEFWRADALTRLAPHLPPGQQADALAQALEAVTAITDESFRRLALINLMSHLPLDLLSRALTAATQASVPAEALAAAIGITDESLRAESLAALAPHLPPNSLAEALAAAIAITDEDCRAEALTGLAPHLPPSLLAQALAETTTISHEYRRAMTLTGLAPHLPPSLLAQALAAATVIADDESRATALAGLAPHLPPHQQADAMTQALAAAAAITDGEFRSRALASIAPHLPPGLLAQALASAPGRGLEAIAAVLERASSVLESPGDGTLLALLRNSMSGADRLSCHIIITLMASTIAEIGGPQAAKECVSVITDVHRWWP